MRDGRARVGDDLAHAARERAQEAAHGLGLGAQEGLGDDDCVAVEPHAVLRVREDDDVGGRHAARLEVEQRGEREAGDRVDVAAHQHGLAQRRVHRGPGHVADVVGAREQREGAPAGVEHRRAQALAAEVGRRADAAAAQCEHGRRGVAVDHHHRHRLVRCGRVVGMEFHQRGEVGEAEVVGAAGHAGHRAGRAVARVDRDVEPLAAEMAARGRAQEQRRRAFEAPVELEAHGGRLCAHVQRGDAECGGGGAGDQGAAGRRGQGGHGGLSVGGGSGTGQQLSCAVCGGPAPACTRPVHQAGACDPGRCAGFTAAGRGGCARRPGSRA